MAARLQSRHTDVGDCQTHQLFYHLHRGDARYRQRCPVHQWITAAAIVGRRAAISYPTDPLVSSGNSSSSQKRDRSWQSKAGDATAYSIPIEQEHGVHTRGANGQQAAVIGSSRFENPTAGQSAQPAVQGIHTKKHIRREPEPQTQASLRGKSASCRMWVDPLYSY